MELIAIIVSSVAVGFTIATFVFSWRRDRNKNTIEAYQDLQEFLFYIYKYKQDEIEIFVTDYQSEEYKTLSACLARIEIFATGIEKKLYNFVCWKLFEYIIQTNLYIA